MHVSSMIVYIFMIIGLFNVCDVCYVCYVVMYMLVSIMIFAEFHMFLYICMIFIFLIQQYNKRAARSSRNNESGWMEDGLAIHFSLAHLEEQGKLSSDVMFPWKRVTDSILKIARNNRQAYVLVWFPHKFGKPPVTGDNPHIHTNVIQRVIPVRTGYHQIKSEVVVWLSAVNFSTSLYEDFADVRQKPWTDEDHWSKFKTHLQNQSSEANLEL